MTGDARKRGEHAESGIQEGWIKKIARLCTIGHDYARFPPSLRPSPGIRRTGKLPASLRRPELPPSLRRPELRRTGRRAGRRTGGWLEGFIATLRFLPLFVISSQKNIFFYLYPPLSTFIDLYPACLALVWRKPALTSQLGRGIPANPRPPAARRTI